MIEQYFQQGMDYLRQHQPERARQVFVEILKQDRTHEQAWLQYARTFPTARQRLQILEQALRTNPSMAQVARTIQLIKKNHQAVPSERTAKPHPSRAAGILAVVAILLLGVSLFWGLLVHLRSQQEIQALQQQNDRLQSEYGQTVNVLESVLREKDQLEINRIFLVNQAGLLAADNNRLLVQSQDLQARLEQLNQAHNQLLTEKLALEGRFVDLTHSYDDLQQTAIVPPYITISERMVTVAFYRLDGSIWNWQFSFDQLEYQIAQGYAFRYSYDHDIWPYRYSRIYEGADGTRYSYPDYVQMVAAEPFRGYIEQLYSQTTSEAQFLQELWYISAQITNYAYDPDEDIDHPRMPLETFLAGGGDCEDTSILFASLVKAAPVDWPVNLVLMNSDVPESTDASQYNHMTVSVSTSSGQYIVETTSHTEMTPYSGRYVGGEYMLVP